MSILLKLILDRQVHGVLFGSQCTLFMLESMVPLIRKAPENNEANAGSQRTLGASRGETIHKLALQDRPFLPSEPSTDGGRETSSWSPKRKLDFFENQSRHTILQARREPFETVGELMSFSKESDNR